MVLLIRQRQNREVTVFIGYRISADLKGTKIHINTQEFDISFNLRQ